MGANFGGNWLVLAAALSIPCIGICQDAGDTPNASQTDASPKSPVIVPPAFLAIPNASDMARFYPIRGMKEGVHGRVTVRCVVPLAGHLHDCQVLSETPADMDFGAATVNMAKTFVMRAGKRDGQPIVEGTYTFTINWIRP